MPCTMTRGPTGPYWLEYDKIVGRLSFAEATEAAAVHRIERSPAMKCTPLLAMIIAILIPGAIEAQGQQSMSQGFSVSSQGLIRRQIAPLTIVSPAGLYTMRISPVRGDFHYLEADLLVTSAAGQEHRLQQVTGNAFFVSDLGRIIAVETAHPTVQPSRIRVLDLSGEVLAALQVDRLSDPALSADGSKLVYRSAPGVVVLDLRSFDETLYPPFNLFAIGPCGELAGISNAHRLHLLANQEEVLSIQLENRPQRIAFAWDGSSLLVLEHSELRRLAIPTGEEATLLVAPEGSRLRDLLVTPQATLVGARVGGVDSWTGELFTLRPDGHLLTCEQGPSRQIPRADNTPKTSRGLPWPLAPNSQHSVGNTYGEYQNYGSAYLHPGVDVMGEPYQPIFAVADGAVKAILTTGGEWHWRIAIGEPTGGTSTGYLYAHVDEPSIAVDIGDPIMRGQYIGDLVPWPIYDFTHCHFARIEDTGYQWYGSWLCTDNPHLDLDNQTETTAPVFEPAVGSDLFAFCDNQSSTYQDPSALHGEVDIIAHVGDQIVSDWVCSVQEIRYTIYPLGDPGYPIVDNKLAVSFDMALDTYQAGPIDPFLVELLYKHDATCHTYGDYDRREFFHIITNSNGDQTYDDIDLWEAWYTHLLPDGDYVVSVTASDVVGNSTTESMVVTTANGNPASLDPVTGTPLMTLRSYPNPTHGEALVSFSVPATDRVRLSVYDPQGRLVRELLQADVPSGTHCVRWDGRDAQGSAMPSGTYLYRLLSSSGTQSERFVLLRR
jgi:murein DD-endopeptidase MepM/ murein hydrolase activator NlpD